MPSDRGTTLRRVEANVVHVAGRYFKVIDVFAGVRCVN